MKNEEQSKIIEKIKKCLALSRSSNQNEAQAALRQAQKMMASYNVSESDIKASTVEDFYVKAGALSRPAAWENMLVSMVCKAFGCDAVHKRHGKTAHWSFIGVGSSAQVAGYAFEVLYRQLKKARKDYLNQYYDGSSVQLKTRRGDIFCIGWIDAVNQKVTSIATAETVEAIKAFKKKEFGEKLEGEIKSSNRVGKVNSADVEVYKYGAEKGKDVNLHHGVSGNDNNNLLGN